MNLPDGTPVRFIPDVNGSTQVILTPEPPEHGGGLASPFTIYIPFTKVDSRTVIAAPANAQWVNVSNHPFAYYAALSSWWAKGETFAIIEHDILCRDDVIKQFDECPEPWCAFGYEDICCIDETGYSPCMEAWANALGCTRFRKEIIDAVPDALTSVDPKFYDWHNACDGLGNNLRAAGFKHHWHFPSVSHHHNLPERELHD